MPVAWMEAYQRYGPALLRKCQRMLGNRHDAEDIVQGLFVDMLSKGKQPEDLPYLYRAVTNRCINFLKYRGNRRRLLERHDEALRGPVRTRCDDTVIGVDLLAKLSEKLDKKSLAVLIYRYFDDMPQEEIAGLLGTSRKTVGKRIAKIKEQVRLLLNNGSGGGS
jgi:RNA polymerase sigma factor (sigma-70 family)